MGKIRCFNCMGVFDSGFEVCPHCGYIISSLPTVAYHLYPKTMLNGRYVIGTVLGHGGFGVTYNAWDTTLNAHVAIKEYFPNGLVQRIPGTTDVIVLSGDKQEQYQLGLDRFLEEAKNTVCFSSHPNIVNVFRFFEENHTAYIVMEFLDGEPLNKYLDQWNGILGIDDALEITCAMCDALTEIHKTKIVHRDVNPNNIFLCDKGVKLIDFGAARISETEFERTRSIVITPGYAPPEQYQSKSRQGPWTDTYSLAATLYRMLTGKRPMESIDRKIEDKLELPSTLNPAIPPWLEQIIMNGMALESELRYQTAEDLKKALESKVGQAMPEERIRKRKRRRFVIFSSAIAASLIAAGTVLWLTMRNQKKAYIIEEGTKLVIEVPEGTESLYESFADDFMSYSDTAKNAELKFISNAENPTLYLNGTHGELTPMNMSDFYQDDIEADKYNFLPELARRSNINFVPTGYYQLFAYQKGMPYDNKGAECSISDLNAMSGGDAMTYLRDLYPDLTKGSLTFRSQRDALQNFAVRKSSVLVGTNADNLKILNVCSSIREQEADAEEKTKLIEGEYYSAAVCNDNGKPLGFWADEWCISDSANSSQKTAARMFLMFLLQEHVQLEMYQGAENSIPAIPLNKAAFSGSESSYLSFQNLLGESEKDSIADIEILDSYVSLTGEIE